ncbi:GNAT family N-acetyltransferase [Enterococcus sp. LJL90]
MKLIAYNPALVPTEKIADYHLPPEQLIFSGLPLDAIEKAAADDSRLPVFLEDQGNFPTFMILHGWPGPQIYTDNQHAVLLRSYSTDSRFQGQGYADASLKLLPAFTKEHFPTAEELILGVNSKNSKAIKLYQKHGFTETLPPLTTEYGQLLLMTLPL